MCSSRKLKTGNPGIKLHVSREYIRIPQNAADPQGSEKFLLSLDLNMSLMEAGSAGAEWSVLTDGNGNLTESPGSNIFTVRNGRIITPLMQDVLKGITG